MVTAMKTLLRLNDLPYGPERVYNGLRLSHALGRHAPDGSVTVILMADAALAVRADHKTPDGYYNVERTLKHVIAARGKVLPCGTCMDARPACRPDDRRLRTQHDGCAPSGDDGSRQSASVLGAYCTVSICPASQRWRC